MKIFEDILDDILIEADIGRRNFIKAAGGTIVSLLSGIGLPTNFITPLAQGKKIYLSLSAIQTTGIDFGSINLDKNFADLKIIFDALNKARVNILCANEEIGHEEDFVLFMSLTAEQLIELHKEGFELNINQDGHGNITHDGFQGPYGNIKWKEVEVSVEKDDIFYYDDYIKIKNPYLTFWNNIARFDPYSAVRHSETLNKLRKAFGGYVQPPILMTSSPADRVGGIWDEDNIHNIDSWESYDIEVEKYKADLEEADSKNNNNEESKEDQKIPYDPYDEYSKDRWSSEGGLAESIKSLHQRVLSEAITLTQAFDQINILGQDKDKQQAFKISLISRLIN